MSDVFYCDRTGKIGYENKAKANKSKSNITRRNSFKTSGESNLEAYKCGSCGHWHLGNTLKSKPRPRSDWHPA